MALPAFYCGPLWARATVRGEQWKSSPQGQGRGSLGDFRYLSSNRRGSRLDFLFLSQMGTSEVSSKALLEGAEEEV